MDENAGGIAGVGVAAHHDVGIAALLEVRIEDRFAGRAPAPGVTWRISYSALIHQMMCYTKPLECHAERFW